MKFPFAVFCAFISSKAFCFDFGSIASSALEEHKVDAVLGAAKVADAAVFEKKDIDTDIKHLNQPQVLDYLTEKLEMVRKICNHPEGVLTVFDQPKLDAWANLSGGDIFLTRGILGEIRNEAELLGILAQQLGKFEIDDKGVSRGLDVSDRMHVYNAAGTVTHSQNGAYFIEGQENDLVVAHSNRKIKEDAVPYAADKLVILGYDPHELLNLLQRLSKDDDESLVARARRLKENSVTWAEQAKILEAYLKDMKIPANPKDPGAKAYQQAMAPLNLTNGAAASK